MSFPTGRKVLIVGGVAAGGSAATRLDNSAQIIMFEKGPHVSFASCGIPYYIGDVIQKEEQLLVTGAMQFKKSFDVDVRVNHNVTKINREKMTVMVEDLENNHVYEESYDELILATGSRPIVPPVDGVSLPGVFQVRNMEDANNIRAWIQTKKATRAVIVGGGFIGLEMAENLVKKELKVTIVDMAPHVMPNLNDELATLLNKELTSHGVDLVTSNGLKAIVQSEEKEKEELVVICQDDSRIPCDLIILAIGVRPNSELAKEAGLAMGVRGTIAVDGRMCTSDPHIHAVGDVVQVKDYVTNMDTFIPLAGPANRQGRLVADVLCGRDCEYRGTQGTSVCGVFDLCVATTGQSAAMLRRSKAPFENVCEVCVHAPHHAGFYPGASPIHLDLTFNRENGRIYGAQAVGTQGVDKRIDVVATLIQMHGTVFDLTQVELSYSPIFGAAKDILNFAGMVAENYCRGIEEPTTWDECFTHEDDIVRLDVRPTTSFDAEPLPNFINIPLGELRARMNEIDKDKEVYISCVIGRTAHTASRLLQANGFKTKHISGGINTYRLLPKKNSLV